MNLATTIIRQTVALDFYFSLVTRVMAVWVPLGAAEILSIGRVLLFLHDHARLVSLIRVSSRLRRDGPPGRHSTAKGADDPCLLQFTPAVR